MYNPFEGWRVTSEYGERIHPKTKKKSFHTGIDLANYDRAPVPAFYGGEVVYAGEGRTGTGFGNMGNVVAIYFIHPYGRPDLHVYLHLHDVLVKAGQTVNSEDIIGTQGNTGAYSMGSHLHFEVRKRASKRIPFGWTKQNDPDMCYEPRQYLVEVNGLLMVAIKKMEEHIKLLESRVESLELSNSMPCPKWAKVAIDKAVAGGLIDTPDGGSYDFYRMVTILDRAGLLESFIKIDRY